MESKDKMRMRWKRVSEKHSVILLKVKILLIIFITWKKKITERAKEYYVEKIQIFNPKAKRYILIDNDTGKILRMKSDKKPYKNVPILKY